MAVATQLDQLCINSSAHFQLMLCSGHSPSFPVRPECGNEQTRSSGAGMLLNMRTAKDVPVHVYRPRNIRVIT